MNMEVFRCLQVCQQNVNMQQLILHRLLMLEQIAKQTHSDECCQNKFEYLSSHRSSILISVARPLAVVL